MKEDIARSNRKPTAFRLDDRNVRLSDQTTAPKAKNEAIITEDIETELEVRLPVAASTSKTHFGFGKWILLGIGGLFSLAVGLAIDSLIRDLFTRNDWLGWLAIGLAALVVIGLAGLILKELAGLARLRKIDHLREKLSKAANEDNTKAATAGLNQLLDLYSDRPTTAKGRRLLQGHMNEIIDGRDLVILAERDLLAPLDQEARRIVLNSSKRVSIVTAISPRALVDLLMVLFENLRIIRRISTLYGGRPGTLGFYRLAKQVVAHLALTGGMAAGDSLASELLGHGLAARLSARLGEGVINGLLTARIGIAAIAVCRPCPFVASNGPSVKEFMGELMPSSDKVNERM